MKPIRITAGPPIPKYQIGTPSTGTIVLSNSVTDAIMAAMPSTCGGTGQARTRDRSFHAHGKADPKESFARAPFAPPAMSTTRSMVKAKVLQSVTGATKKPSTTTAAGNSLIDSTNSLGSHAPSVKKTTTASRSSLLPNSITTPITPRANTASAVSRYVTVDPMRNTPKQALAAFETDQILLLAHFSEYPHMQSP